MQKLKNYLLIKGKPLFFISIRQFTILKYRVLQDLKTQGGLLLFSKADNNKKIIKIMP